MTDYLDVPTAIDEVFKGYGSNDAQRGDAVLVLARDFAVNAGAIIHKETGLPIDDPKVKTYYVEHKPHLMPAVYSRSLADRAFLDGNVTARGQLLKEIGELEATRLAQSYGLRGLGDTRRGAAPDTGDANGKKPGNDGRNNPWSDWPGNLDKHGRYNAAAMGRQSSICRSLGVAKAAELSAPWGFIGSTAPLKRRA